MTQAVSIIQSYRCGFTAVLPNRIVVFDGIASVLAATAANFPLVGVSTEVGGDSNQTMDVVVGGIGYVQMAQAVSPGNLITSDGVGQGVAAIAGNRVVGVLLETATTAGQICKIAVFPSVF